MFIVDWSDEAFDEMQAIYDAHRGNLTDIIFAHRKLFTELRTKPLTAGESRTGHERLAFFDPLAIVFEVDADYDYVEILSVRHYRKTQ